MTTPKPQEQPMPTQQTIDISTKSEIELKAFMNDLRDEAQLIDRNIMIIRQELARRASSQTNGAVKTKPPKKKK